MSRPCPFVPGFIICRSSLPDRLLVWFWGLFWGQFLGSVLGAVFGDGCSVWVQYLGAVFGCGIWVRYLGAVTGAVTGVVTGVVMGVV